MNVDVFIPVRLDSKRLPKKHLQKINGVTLIELLINRIRESKKVRNIVVCTTNKKSDDQLVNLLEQKNIMFYRGDKKDILTRFLDAAKKFDTEIIIDVEGDKLYIEPKFIDKVILEMEKNNYDFMIGNDSSEKFNPNDHLIHGIIPTAIRVDCLEKICNGTDDENRETGYKEIFIKNPLVKKKFYLFSTKLKVPKELRLTIDYPEDLAFARELFAKLKKKFTYEDILKIIEKEPEIIKNLENINEKWYKNYKEEKDNAV